MGCQVLTHWCDARSADAVADDDAWDGSWNELLAGTMNVTRQTFRGSAQPNQPLVLPLGPPLRDSLHIHDSFLFYCICLEACDLCVLRVVSRLWLHYTLAFPLGQVARIF